MNAAVDPMHPIESPDKSRGNLLPKILAMELEVRGHHADYVKNFAAVWREQEIPAKIKFLTTPRFRDYHANIVDFFASLDDSRIELAFISDAEQALLDRHPRLKHWNGWKLFCRYSQREQADHGLLMYFDHFQLPMVLGQRAPCPFSVIYFRPTFHYSSFKKYRPSWKQRIRAIQKEWLLRQVLKLQQLRELYCLDPLVIPYLQRTGTGLVRVSHLADSFSKPVPADRDLREIKSELGIEAHRRIFCMLGVLDSRKGPRPLLEAIPHINPLLGQKICILLLGYIPAATADEIEKLAKRMDGVANVQVILRNQYIDSERVQTYYDVSDVILTTYQNHMGSSSAIIRAALARKPILSSDYGLIGELVATQNLGVVVDSLDPKAIASGIEAMATDDLSRFSNAQATSQLVNDNSPEQLALDLARMLDHIPRVRPVISPISSLASTEMAV